MFLVESGDIFSLNKNITTSLLRKSYFPPNVRYVFWVYLLKNDFLGQINEILGE